MSVTSPERTIERATRGRAGDAPFLVFAALLYLVALGISVLGGLSGVQVLLAPGFALLVVSAIAFLRQGGVAINASAILSYGLTIFAAFPAVYIGLGLYPLRRLPTDEGMLMAISLCFALQFLVIAICPRNALHPIAGAARARDSANAASRAPWYIGGVVLLIAALLVERFGFEYIAPGLGFAAVLVSATGAFGIPERRVGVFSLGLLGVVVICYVELIFDGFGRLSLAVIAIAVAALASIRLQSTWLKPLVLGGTIPALAYMSAQRLGYLLEVRGTIASPHEGIGSVVGPLMSSALIVDAFDDARILPAMGGTFVTALLVWVPRALWPSKPLGFGAEIVPVTQPELSGAVGFSDAALITGEAVWNYGPLFGLIVLALVAVCARMLDTRLVRTWYPEASSRDRVVRALIVLLSASLLNLFWGGLFTLISRGLAPLGLFLIIWFFTRPTARSRDQPEASPRRDGVR